ncbi:MAG: hypothetical protein L0922_05505, partial [Candidatus Mariimomonas ferrooxydans]
MGFTQIKKRRIWNQLKWLSCEIEKTFVHYLFPDSIPIARIFFVVIRVTTPEVPKPSTLPQPSLTGQGTPH